MSLPLRRKIAAPRRIAARAAQVLADIDLRNRLRAARQALRTARTALTVAKATGTAADIVAAQDDVDAKLAALRGIF